MSRKVRTEDYCYIPDEAKLAQIGKISSASTIFVFFEF